MDEMCHINLPLKPVPSKEIRIVCLFPNLITIVALLAEGFNPFVFLEFHQR